MLRKIFYALLLILVILQFVPVKKNQSNEQTAHISTVKAMPADVAQILKTSCYDCHSNYTEYPWYTSIQPIGLWLQNHVKGGKKEVNFSEFANYSKEDQEHVLEEIEEVIMENEMPLNSYTWIHKDAILSQEQKQAIILWTKQ